MYTKEELSEKSCEEIYVGKEDEARRLFDYDRKIDKILHCILTDKEIRVFDLKIGTRASWVDISKATNSPESTVRAVFGKIERKLKLFRRIFDLA